MTIDLGGHLLQNSWSSELVGSTGVVTVTPLADGRTVRARNKTSFGFCLQRDAVSLSKANHQVQVRAVLW
jgi:hypothetical protein